MNWIRFFTGATVFLLCALLSDPIAAAESRTPSAPGTFVGWATNGPAVYRQRVVFNQVLPGPALSYIPTPTNLPLDLRASMLAFRAAANVVFVPRTEDVFDHFRPESLNNVVWTNFIANTNARSMVIWSARTRPLGWPLRPPVVQWNTNCLMWGMKGLTALSPSWEGEGNPGQAPITALTRRHGYTRGHGMGADRIGTVFAGMKVWFLTTENTLVQTKVLREVVRTRETSGRDYTIVLFNSDLPQNIQPMRVIETRYRLPPLGNPRYVECPGAPYPIFKTEQSGGVSAEVPGFTINTFKGGDSGSPNMLPMPDELVFCSGRSTSVATPEMQADMDELCRRAGLDPKRYQLQWIDLSRYPIY